MWQQSTAAVRYVYARGVEAIQYLDKLPWLLARLDAPGIAARCVMAYAATPPHLHHPLPREFLDPGHLSGLRAMVDEVDEAGSNMHPTLRDAV